MTLPQGERAIRQYDRALRLRRSLERSDTVLLERKVYRGRVGRMTFDRQPLTPDGGYRAEWGHVLVASFPFAYLVANGIHDLVDSLKRSDTWRRSESWIRDLEDREQLDRDIKRHARSDGLKHKASETFDRLMWTTKSRVSVPETIV